MGLFNGGLLGAIARQRQAKMEQEIRKAAAREFCNSFNQPRTYGSSSHGWECRFCGIKMKSYSGNRTSRPSVRQGGGCRNSPYGAHEWIEF